MASKLYATDKSGNSFITGSISPSGVNNARDVFVIKIDKNGALLWVNTFNGPDGLSDQVSDMEVLKSGDVVVVGNSFSGRAIVQYDAGGALDWSQFSPGPYNSAHSLVTDKSKSVIVTSTISTFDGIETVKYNKKGVLLYSDTYTFANSDIVVRNLAVSCAGNFYFGA